MKPVIILPALIILISSSFCIHALSPNAPSDRLQYYPFDGKYIDLELLDIAAHAGFHDKDFKTESKYAFRFSIPNEWEGNFLQRADYGGSTYAIKDDRSLWIKIGRDMEKKIDAPADDDLTDNVVGSDFILAVNGGVVRLIRLGSNMYNLSKYDSVGTEVFSVSFEHTEVSIEENTHYHHPYLYYFGCTPDVMLFTSNDRDYKKTLAVSLADGKVTTYNFTIAGFIRDEDEANVPGFVIIDDDREQLETLLLNLSWKAPMPGNWYNRAEIVMKGEVLYISLYHSISTGSSLYAFDKSTGEQLWKADVKQLMVGHSEYYNTVYLSSYKDKIILEVVEAGGHYVQVFDEATGELLFSTF